MSRVRTIFFCFASQSGIPNAAMEFPLTTSFSSSTVTFVGTCSSVEGCSTTSFSDAKAMCGAAEPMELPWMVGSRPLGGWSALLFAMTDYRVEEEKSGDETVNVVGKSQSYTLQDSPQCSAKTPDVINCPTSWVASLEFSQHCLGDVRGIGTVELIRQGALNQEHTLLVRIQVASPQKPRA